MWGHVIYRHKRKNISGTWMQKQHSAQISEEENENGMIEMGMMLFGMTHYWAFLGRSGFRPDLKLCNDVG